MNYQPFLEMNLLVSDQLISEFHQLLPTLILLLVLCFYLLMALHISLFSLWKLLGQPPKKRSYMVSTNE